MVGEGAEREGAAAKEDDDDAGFAFDEVFQKEALGRRQGDVVAVAVMRRGNGLAFLAFEQGGEAEAGNGDITRGAVELGPFEGVLLGGGEERAGAVIGSDAFGERGGEAVEEGDGAGGESVVVTEEGVLRGGEGAGDVEAADVGAEGEDVVAVFEEDAGGDGGFVGEGGVRRAGNDGLGGGGRDQGLRLSSAGSNMPSLKRARRWRERARSMSASVMRPR